MNRRQRRLILLVLLGLTGSQLAVGQVYKWTDASGQVHYGQKKPDDAAQTQTLDIPSAPAASSTASADPSAEIARIKALTERMARERQAVEQARQEQAIRDLEQENQQLQNDLLTQKLQEQKDQQEKEDNQTLLLGYPPPYPYPYPYPYPRPFPPYPPKPAPPHPWPCEPWPACRQPVPPPSRPAPPARAPIPPFNPKPVGVGLTPDGFTRHR